MVSLVSSKLSHSSLSISTTGLRSPPPSDAACRAQRRCLLSPRAPCGCLAQLSVLLPVLLWLLPPAPLAGCGRSLSSCVLPSSAPTDPSPSLLTSHPALLLAHLARVSGHPLSSLVLLLHAASALLRAASPSALLASHSLLGVPL